MRKNLNKIIIACAIALLILPAMHSEEIEPVAMGSEYEGRLRIYIAEIESRWDMYNGAPYHYAFLDYAFNDDIEIAYLETYEDSMTWQGDVDEGNVMIMAAVFNPEEHRGYSDPPDRQPFDAYYVDAAAGCEPGESYTNVKNEDFTHTVFCEIGTATWCSACPYMADEVHSVYEQGDYPFFYIELVTDKSNLANARAGDFNQKYLPTGYYDGGYNVVVGGGAGTSYHKEIIENSGKRDVHDLDLTLSAEWTDGKIKIDISITNNEELPNAGPDNPTITGPSEGKPGETYEFDIRTTDPDDDDVYYMIDWDDGSEMNWIGPYSSGQTITESHSWAEEGNFIVKVKAKDPEGLETEWIWHKVSVPKSKGFDHPFFEWFFTLFPMLEQLFF